jgi:hypothetical protein
LDVVADRGNFKGEEILACEQAGVAVTLPKLQTSGAKSAGRFGKPDFVYLAKDDAYRCPAGCAEFCGLPAKLVSRSENLAGYGAGFVGGFVHLGDVARNRRAPK